MMMMIMMLLGLCVITGAEWDDDVVFAMCPCRQSWWTETPPRWLQTTSPIHAFSTLMLFLRPSTHREISALRPSGLCLGLPGRDSKGKGKVNYSHGQYSCEHRLYDVGVGAHLPFHGLEPAVGLHPVLWTTPLPQPAVTSPAFTSVPKYTAWWQRHMGVSNLLRVVTW